MTSTSTTTGAAGGTAGRGGTDGITGTADLAPNSRWRELRKITAIETRLFFRDTGTWAVAIVLPPAILVVLGLIPALREPSEQFGGQRFVEYFAPSLIVLTVLALGVLNLPIRLAGYREKGVLKRLSTTPARPSNLLIAQLVINLVMVVAGVILLIIIGWLVYDISPPAHLAGFAGAFVVGVGALFAIGTLIAARASTPRAANSMAMPLFFVSMFLGGVYLPRFLLPDFIITLGSYAPPGIQALLDAWAGTAPALVPLAIMLAVAVVAGAAAAKSFRWE